MTSSPMRRLAYIELAPERVASTLLEPGVPPRQSTLTPLLKLVYRPDTSRETAFTDSPRNRRSTTALAPSRPPLHLASTYLQFIRHPTTPSSDTI